VKEIRKNRRDFLSCSVLKHLSPPLRVTIIVIYRGIWVDKEYIDKESIYET
jgi:hypothetical protein